MADAKKYLDLVGLQQLVTSTKSYVEGEINKLDSTSTGEGTIVKGVSQENGKVSVTVGTLSADEIPALTLAKITDAGTAAAKDVATVAIAEESTDTSLVTAAQVAKFVKDETAALEGATHFIGVKTELPTTGMKSGDICIVGVKEYIYDGTAWKELGDESIYVTKTTTIAGVDLENNITKEEMLTALNVADGAQVNVLEGVQVNGTDLAITDKKVNVTVATGSANGTVAVNGADVAVKGLGSAAYTETTAYDAAGTAATLVGTLTSLTTTNKTDAVSAINEVDAAVKAIDYSGKADKVKSATAGNFAGLDANGNLTDSGKKATDFDAAGAAATVKTEVIGTAADLKSADTIYGAKAYADDAVKTAKEAFDAEITVDGTATDANGLSLHIKEEDGVITELTGSINTIATSEVIALLA